MSLSKKSLSTSVKRNYILYFETSLILSLLSVIGLFKAELPQQDLSSVFSIPDQEILHLEAIELTNQDKEKPNPPAPANVFVPFQLPKEKLLVAKLRDLDIEFNMPEPMAVSTPEKKAYRDNKINTDTFSFVDQMPELIGGREGLQNRIRYPRRAIRDNVEGRVVVQFVVDEKGKVQKPELIKGVRADINKEALKAITKSRFKPGRLAGKAVRVEYIMFIQFRLEFNS